MEACKRFAVDEAATALCHVEPPNPTDEEPQISGFSASPSLDSISEPRFFLTAIRVSGISACGGKYSNAIIHLHSETLGSSSKCHFAINSAREISESLQDWKAVTPLSKAFAIPS